MSTEFRLEEKLKDLDKIISLLESDELTLEDQLREYEKGIDIIKECRNYIETTEQKINELSKS
jgi:exodeoxyribonuclease VII small subunit